MPDMGKLQRVAMVQTSVFELSVNMSSSMASENRNHTPEQTPNIYKYKTMGGLTLKEKITRGGLMA